MKLETAVIKTKIMIPKRRREIMTRPRLLSAMQNVLDVRLLILAAPAGYGKTSLLVDYANHTKVPVCWLSLDPLDCDPQRFVAHFISALAVRFPSFGKLAFSTISELNQDHLNYDPVIAAIVNDAYENITEHFVFVIEDYHLVRDSKQIEPFINRIIQEMAENCHFIISSRVLLTLPDLSLLVARNQVAGLSFEELAFLPEELKQLIETNYHQNISEAYARELVTQTEGWITGLLLSTQISPKGNEDRIRLAKVSGIGVYEYLAQQVFNRQSIEVQQFLLRTSLLSEFDASLCKTVIGQALDLERYPWHERISQILRENLFVVSVGEETLFIRYHHLFRDFLQNRMRLQNPNETRKIESALANHYEQMHQWELAFEILNRLGDENGIYELIYNAAPSMINSGKLITLSHWFDCLTDEKLKNAPEMLSIQATVALVRGKTEESLELLNQAIIGLRQPGKEIDLCRSLNRRSIVYHHLGDYQSNYRDAEEAIDITEGRNGFEAIRAEAFRMRGLSLFQQGDLLGSLDSLKKARYLFESYGQKEDTAEVLMELGLAQRRLGNFENAEKAYEDALKQWQSSGNSMWQSNVLNNLGYLQNLRSQYEQAGLSFERSLQHARLAVYPRGEGFILLSLGDLYKDLRAYEEARQAYHLVEEIEVTAFDPVINMYIALSRASVERLEGRFTSAKQLLDEVQEISSKTGSLYEANLLIIERALFLIRIGEIEGLEDRLTSLEQEFSQKKELTDALRVGLINSIIAIKSKNWIRVKNDLQRVYDSKLRDSTSNLFIQIGSEFKSTLLDAVENLQGYEPLLFILRLVDDYEKRLPEIVKNIKRQNTVVQFTNSQISIKTFGKMQVKLGDHLVNSGDWQSQTSRDLFFYILAHPTGVSKEQIGAAFWPDSSSEELKIRFKNAIYRLRRAVGNDTVTYENEIYAFNRKIDYDYDVERFSRDLAQARSSSEEDLQIKCYKTAVAAYQGVYLPKIEQTWVLAQRQQYEEQFIEAALKLANLTLQQGNSQSVLLITKRILEQDPCNEAAYRINMQAYSTLGDRSSVKRAFDMCKQTLLSELGVEPSEATGHLFEVLMS
jgi:ATP/maltotriose-dependent transcriptional regulator MalT/DNA-binding SARP family transcriptional activator